MEWAFSVFGALSLILLGGGLYIELRTLEPQDRPIPEELLDGLTDGQRVDMQVDSDGVVRYVSRELNS